MTKQGRNWFAAIVATFIICCGLLVCGGMATTIIVGWSTQRAYYDHKETFTAKVVRKYEYVYNGQTTYRVDVQKQGSETAETIQNADDPWLKKWDAATIHANLKEGETYKFDVVGMRQEPYLFPNIMKAERVPPKPQ